MPDIVEEFEDENDVICFVITDTSLKDLNVQNEFDESTNLIENEFLLSENDTQKENPCSDVEKSSNSSIESQNIECDASLPSEIVLFELENIIDKVIIESEKSKECSANEELKTEDKLLISEKQENVPNNDLAVIQAFIEEERIHNEITPRKPPTIRKFPVSTKLNTIKAEGEACLESENDDENIA